MNFILSTNYSRKIDFKSSINLLLLITVIFLLLIIFETLRHHYYLTTFGKLTGLSFWNLFQNHFIRWTIWVISALVYIRIAKAFKPSNWYFMVAQIPIISFLILVDLVLISLISVSIRNVSSYSGFLTLFEFFTYQNGWQFFIGFIPLILYNSGHLSIKTPKSSHYEDQLTIKTGRMVKVIHYSQIECIESDNYCVKIHTWEGASYTHRISLKKMQELLDFNFIRIHRTSIVHKSAIAELRRGKIAYMKLKSGKVLKVSASSFKTVVKILENNLV